MYGTYFAFREGTFIQKRRLFRKSFYFRFERTIKRTENDFQMNGYAVRCSFEVAFIFRKFEKGVYLLISTFLNLV